MARKPSLCKCLKCLKLFTEFRTFKHSSWHSYLLERNFNHRGLQIAYRFPDKKGGREEKGKTEKRGDVEPGKKETKKNEAEQERTGESGNQNNKDVQKSVILTFNFGIPA